MATPTLIYCAGGSKRYASIAIENGFKYGAKLPSTVYFPVYFADQDWKSPNRERYIQALWKEKPYIASAIDWTHLGQLEEVLSWAEDIAGICEKIMIIPKVHGGTSMLPKKINGKQIVLGYSVPTSYGGTDLFISEFVGWPVHLLGGSPLKQFRLSYYIENIVSIDGNYASKMATKFCRFFSPGNSLLDSRNPNWPTVASFDGKIWSEANYEAFRRSCINIKKMWASR